MGRPVEKFVVYNLRETYHELGDYEIKIVLSSRHFKNSHHCELTLVDSDGKPMPCQVERWGRKINCTFNINSNVADGVSLIRLILKKDESSNPTESRLTFWVIKP